MDTMAVHEEYHVTSITVDYDSKEFIVRFQGYQPIEILFLEIESFIAEYDDKLAKYLERIDKLEDKIFEAIDIGYDFTNMVADFLKSMIEYDLISPRKI